MEAFASELRQLRQEAGLTYAALAEQAGLALSTVAAAARGNSLPTWEVVAAYVTACRGDVEWWRQRWVRACRETGRPVPAAVAAAGPARDDPPSPAGIADAAGLVAGMAALRAWAGQPSLAELNRRSGGRLPRSTVSDVLRRASLPRQELLLDFVRACGLDNDQVGEWDREWRRLAAPPSVIPRPSPPRWSRRQIAVRAALLVLIPALVSVLVAQTLRSQPGSPPPTPGTLTIGVVADEPGWAMYDAASGSHAGFDIDLAAWLAEERGLKPLFVDFGASGLLPALQSGAVQMVVSTLGITGVGRTQAIFAGPYAITSQGVLTRAGGSEIRTTGDLSRKRVCTTGIATADVPYIQVRRQSLGQCATMLSSGVVDAVAGPLAVLDGLASAEPDNFKVIAGSLGGSYQFGIGLPPGDVTGCRIYTRLLREFITNGMWNEDLRANVPDASMTGMKPSISALLTCN